MTRHRIKRLLLSTILTLSIAVSGMGITLASKSVQPSLFALSPLAFPPGSRLLWSGVESNRGLLRHDQFHFGVPPSALGRITGYYMDAVEGDPASPSHPYTSYLVSIFRSVTGARTAFNTRWNAWFVANYYTSPMPAPIAVGARGEAALFRSLDAGEPPFSELLFRRGAVLVEVFQGTGGTAPAAAQVRSFYAIATALDRLARHHPAGV